MSNHHLKALVQYNSLLKEQGQIDKELKKEIENTTKYWLNVLRRVIDDILFLSERSLAFRGTNEILGSPNNGNFLGIIELLSKYDPFLEEHIKKYGNCGSGHVNYLSSTIYEELIEEIAKLVFSEILIRLKKAKIYSISLDGTSDEGHVDQLTFIFRYVENSTPVERFLKFLPNQGHKAVDMFNALIHFLKENDIDISNCRGQSYDNASTMSGKFNGLQALVAKENDLAIWIPCVGHSLNLTGEKASDASTSSTNYFMFLQSIYVFFSASDWR
ncbi:PREDICTED: zinc finger MYM-type protein 1-like [Cyphomyrmex costatus]|uniref:zinc finger MYM-type protein 1-like n=1 Tax=Cyphomyrmex costatus TaxID=456900 RepID=UPI0008522D50|nr:PREDICTED: zinc finger MYM-type protein 1-like [Cyphomyrmex costatus]